MQDIPYPPKSENLKNYPILTVKVIGSLIVFLIALDLFLRWTLPAPTIQASDLTVENIITGINRERQLRNLLTLNTNQMLSIAAQSKTDDMIARHYFSHTDPEGNYIWPKIEAAGYTPYSQLGENLAIEFTNTDSLISAWMNSPTHRANVLNGGFEDQGMGLSLGDESRGQYSSAVANTFGTLLVVHKQPVLSANTGTNSALPQSKLSQPVPSVPKTISKSTSTATTKPKASASANPAPAAIPTPPTTPASPAITQDQPSNTPQTPHQPLAIRGDESQPSFATPSHETAAPTTTPPASATPAAQVSLKSTLNSLSSNLDSANAGRYVTLGAGLLLLLLLLSDLRITLQKNLQKIDKKINNLVLLMLAIIVAALMYWL